MIPGYFLVWYDSGQIGNIAQKAVIPGYFLVWYDCRQLLNFSAVAVIPGYFLVWYDQHPIPDMLLWSCDSRLFLGMV